MPRKSIAAQSTPNLVSIEDRRPAPPADLSPEEAEIWRAALAATPSALFKPSDLPLLRLYVQHVSMAVKLSAEIDKFDLDWAWKDTGLPQLAQLLGLRDREVRAATSLGTRLRLTPASRITPAKASTMIAAEPDPSEPKPWEPVPTPRRRAKQAG